MGAYGRWAALAALLALCAGLAKPVEAGQAADARKNVLVVFSNEGLLPAMQSISSALVDTLQATAPDRFSLFSEYLDAARFPQPELEAPLLASLQVKYAATPMDLTVAVGSQALEFLTRNRSRLFPQVPIVFVGVSEAELPDRALLPNAFGAVSRLDPVKTVELALALQPDAKTLVVVSGASPFDKEWEQAARSRLAPFEGRLQLDYLVGLSVPDLLTQVARLPPRSIVLFLSVIKDGTGAVFISRDVAQKVATAANAPVYGVYSTYLGRGIVGGYIETFEAMGTTAAQLILRVLGGEKRESIPATTVSPSSFMVDWRELHRWGLKESNLPPDTVALFKEPSLWDEYRSEVLAAIAVVVVQLAFIAGLLIQERRRRRAEQFLRESEDRYRNVVETQTELICRYLPDTTLTFVNDAYCRHFKKSRDELVGRKFLELIPEAARAGAMDYVASLASTAGAKTIEHEVLRPDGTIGWQQWTDHVILDAQGRVTEVQGIGRDVSALKQAEMDAHDRRQELAHVSRVAILGELSGALAHELNQPLTAILSNAQAAQRLLAQTPPDLHEIREILRDIGEEDRRAGDVINRLRALMKNGEAIFLPLTLNDLANEVLELMHSELIERNVVVTSDLASGLPKIRGDRVQLQQVLLNLIMNACEAMAGNASDRHLSVSTAQGEDGAVTLAVADRGPGIPCDLVDRIFEPFVTTKANGLGLGLSICRSIVTAHRGRLWLENGPDGGATAFVSLPLHDGDG